MKSKRFKARLNEVAEIVTGKTPSSSFKDSWGSEIDFLTPSDIGWAEFYPTTERKLSREGSERMSSKIVSVPSVGVVCIGGTIGKIARISKPTLTNQQINTVIPKSGLCDADYLYYALQTYVGLFRSASGGSATPLLNKSQFGDIAIELPNLLVQKAVGRFLSDIDELIHVNKKLAQSLDSLVMTNFNAAFEESLAGAQISLSELATITLGGTPSRKKKEYWGGSIPWVNSSAANEFRISHASEYITDLGLAKSSAKLMSPRTTVIAITGSTLGQVSRLEIEAAGNQSLVGVLGNSEELNDFLFLYIRNSIKRVTAAATGGAQQHINKENIAGFEVSLPPEHILRTWHEGSKDFLTAIGDLWNENERLARIRAEIFPLLISGDLSFTELADTS